MKKIVYLIILCIPFGLHAQLYVSSGETVTVVEGTDVFFAGVEVEATGLLDVQASSVITNCVINGEITGDDQINFGDLTSLDVDNGTWDVSWDSPNENNEVLSSLSIGVNGFVKVLSNNSLTINGAMANYNPGTGIVLLADAAGYAQLLTLGATLPGTTEAQQFFTESTQEGFRQFASPIVTDLEDIKDDFDFNYASPDLTDIWWYDASPILPGGTATPIDPVSGSDANAKYWTNSLANENIGPANNAKAWNLYMGDPNTVFNSGLMTLTGEFGNGNYTFDCYRTNDFIDGMSGETDPNLITGWNLIPNPYPSNIDVSTLLADGTNFPLSYKAVHVWNAKFQQYIAITDLVTSSIIDWNNAPASAEDATHNIAPFQAFWVKAAPTPSTSAVADESITLTNAHRTVEDNYNVFKTTPPLLRFRLADASEEFTDQSVLAFNESATIGTDNYDAYKLLTTAKNTPSLYTTVDGLRMAINYLPDPAPYHSIPLYATSPKNGEQYSIEMRLENVNPTWTIYLEDVKTGKMHNLRNGAYTFIQDETINKNRFVVHINKLPGNIDATSFNNINIYNTTDAINVAFANPHEATAEITISNMAGQLLYNGTVSTGRLFTFPLQGKRAIYAVKVVSGVKLERAKIVN